ncbi:MAG: hypothetical protein FIA97_04275 [Methylococcaceae bacterium]|nr:hypothetical protein [Methylococcaceae bacterium]
MIQQAIHGDAGYFPASKIIQKPYQFVWDLTWVQIENHRIESFFGADSDDLVAKGLVFGEASPGKSLKISSGQNFAANQQSARHAGLTQGIRQYQHSGQVAQSDGGGSMANQQYHGRVRITG